MMELVGYALPLSLAGGGGMAQDSFLGRFGYYLVWGGLMLIVCAIAALVLRRLYRDKGE
jgi:uncharacterized membrane protein YeiH